MSIEAKGKNTGLLFDMFEASEEGEVPINSKGPETRSRFPGDTRFSYHIYDGDYRLW